MFPVSGMSHANVPSLCPVSSRFIHMTLGFWWSLTEITATDSTRAWCKNYQKRLPTFDTCAWHAGRGSGWRGIGHWREAPVGWTSIGKSDVHSESIGLGKLWPLKQLHPQHPFKQLCYRIFLTKGSSCGAIPWVLQFYYVLLDEVEGWASPIAWRLLFICRTGTFGMFMVFAAQAMSFLVFGSKIANTCHLTLRFLWKLNTLTWRRAEIRGYKGDTWKT